MCRFKRILDDVKAETGMSKELNSDTDEFTFRCLSGSIVSKQHFLTVALTVKF
jgi:hypothetical protein